RRSKTDQEGAGRTVALPYSGTPGMCPVRRLQAWLDGSGITEGPLFRYVNRHGTVGPAALSGQAVSEAIRRAARRAGLEADGFSGHSLRAGFVTQAMLARKADRDIMKQTGHKSLAMLLRYDRRADMWRDNAAAGLLD
ncbi:MAG: tyrosine-type recombinase/integrase, partial [Myxococcales bacterium]|nr:tyrosine-type recombinase/integrase [Myxococcales bacterium]